MAQPTPALELRNVVRTFAKGSVRAVDGVTLDVAPGEIVSILGPSGCGKTTMMRMVAGLDHPSTGQIRIHGTDVTGQQPYQRNVGLVFQSLAVFPHMDVRRNVGFGLRMRGVAADVIAKKVRDILWLVQLPPDKFADRWPQELSGGQLQRVALARTLVTEPALVLFDEPMAALDRRLRDYMAIEMRAIQKQLGIAAVYVTHDQETASAMSDRIAVMDAGRIVQVGPPQEIYEAPASRFVAEFLGDANVLQAERIIERSADSLDIQVVGNRRMRVRVRADPADGMLAVFRPNQTRVHPAKPSSDALEGKLLGMQFNGGLYRWQVGLGVGTIVHAQASENLLDGVPVDSPIWVSVDPSKAYLVDG
jgi:putative spermidine/putrescine transport system ATP-binding protein